MKLAFRTDASLDIGSGHVMRCLTLATALREQNAECRFICRVHPGNLIDHIRDSGFDVTALPADTQWQPGNAGSFEPLPSHVDWLRTNWRTDADATIAALESFHPDWLVVDHYALGRVWEQQVRPLCTRLMVIDDLADRPHDCDLLLDQNLGREPADYTDLVPATSTVLTGTRYALLRPEFAALREYSLQRREHPRLRHILISMGGIDQVNATGQVLDALRRGPLPLDCRVTVIMGQHAPWLAKVQAQAVDLPCPCEVKVNISNMAQLMADSDLAIGAAGSTSWERCALGLPALIVVLAVNQCEAAANLQEKGAATIVSLHDSDDEISVVLSRMSTASLRTQSRHGASLVDGDGTSRVVQIVNSGGH